MQLEKLTESEELVMKAIWEGPEEQVLSDVFKRLRECHEKDWKPQTVSTFLAKLVRKNYLQMRRNGKAYIYTIQVPQEVYSRERLKWLCTFLYNGDKETVKKDLEVL